MLKKIIYFSDEQIELIILERFLTGPTVPVTNLLNMDFSKFEGTVGLNIFVDFDTFFNYTLYHEQLNQANREKRTGD